MAAEWRTTTFQGVGPQSTWASGQLGSPGYKSICQWFEGETILRVRIQGQVTFAVHDTDPTHVAMGSFDAGGQGCYFGVWAKKDGGAATPTDGVPFIGSVNDAFVFYNMMSLVSLSEFHEQLDTDDWTATYAFTGDSGDSHSSRGPATADTDVWLVYGFENTGINPPFDSSFTLATFYGFNLNVSCLFTHV